jgi:hypothetical protein
MILTGENPSTWGKTCPSDTLSTTKPTWTDPGLNPGLRGERPATIRLSHGTAVVNNKFVSEGKQSFFDVLYMNISRKIISSYYSGLFLLASAGVEGYSCKLHLITLNDTHKLGKNSS